MENATIINIQKYSIHDGPGIRTTVFFKGCPLNCFWCHNPESQKLAPEIIFFEDRCTKCGTCIKICPSNAIIPENCIGCGVCSDICPNNARELSGKFFTTHELMKEIKKDEIFYEESGGGVTFSGGEPLIQSAFLKEILPLCKNREIHTAIDTCGFASWENIEQILDNIDLFLYDLKLMDDKKHIKYTGVSNKIILENLKKLSNLEKRIFIRIPIISGINDDYENIKNSAEFLSKLNIEQVNLLPYHKMGMEKYKRINKEYKMTGYEKPSDDKLKEIQGIFKTFDIKTRIGG